jgi:transcriptional regulator with XRE-family HTH domain
MDPAELGPHIQQLRNRRGVSLRELARDAEMAPASLSAIEKGSSSPTLATLHKVLKALGTDFAEFFQNGSTVEETPVFPASRMRSLEDAHRRYVLLFPRREDLRFEMVAETLEPGESEGELEWETHDCDLGGQVLSGGPLKLEIRDRGQWTLRRGDAFYIHAGQPHRARNLGRRPLKMISVVDPPRY